MTYSPYHALIAPARSSAALWRLGLGSMTALALFILFNIAYFQGIARLLFPAQPQDAAGALADGRTPLSMLVLLFTFACAIPALWLALKLVHRRSLAGLIGAPRVAMRQFLRVMAGLVVLYAALSLIPLPDAYRPITASGLEPRRWLAVLPLALLAIAVQISSEELVFRGYLQSQLAARFRSPLVWLVIPAVVFGALHYDGASAGENAWIIAALAGLFGLCAADLTARSGTLGPALAFHFVNNSSALLLAAPSGYLDGLALWRYPFDLSDLQAVRFWAPVDMVTILCGWGIARLSLRR